MLTIIKDELREIQREIRHSPRRTQIVPDEGEISIEDLIANEGVIITITHNGFIKRTAVSAYRAQRRGGKGVIGMTTREAATEEDERLRRASLHRHDARLPDVLHEDGRCYVERVLRDSRDGSRASKGRTIANLLELRAGRKDRRDHSHPIEAQWDGPERS